MQMRLSRGLRAVGAADERVGPKAKALKRLSSFDAPAKCGATGEGSSRGKASRSRARFAMLLGVSAGPASVPDWQWAGSVHCINPGARGGALVAVAPFLRSGGQLFLVGQEVWREQDTRPPGRPGIGDCVPVGFRMHVLVVVVIAAQVGHGAFVAAAKSVAIVVALIVGHRRVTIGVVVVSIGPAV